VDEIGEPPISETVTPPFQVTDRFRIGELLAGKNQDHIALFVADRQVFERKHSFIRRFRCAEPRCHRISPRWLTGHTEESRCRQQRAHTDDPYDG